MPEPAACESVMKARLRRQLDRDVDSLNGFFDTFRESAVLLGELVEQAEDVFGKMTEEELKSLPPDTGTLFRFVQDHFKEIKEGSTWGEVFDFGEALDRIVDAKFNAKLARELRLIRAEIERNRENLNAAVLRINSPQALTPAQFIEALRAAIPKGKIGPKRMLGDLARTYRGLKVQQSEADYRKGAAAWTQILTILSLNLGIIAKWIDYGLEEWESSQRRGRTPSQE